MLPFPPITAQSELFNEAVIKQVTIETPEASTFVIEPVEGTWNWKAGQFITFVIPTLTGLVRRSYSFSSAPGEIPAITVKRIPNGIFSRPMLEAASPGDRLTVAGGPSGFFVLPDEVETYDQLFFLAAGSGITPIFAMIKDLLNRGIHLPIVLAYSNSSPATALFRQPLERLAQSHPNLKIKWYYSNEQDLLKARLSKTTLEILLGESLRGSPLKTLAYLCGPFDYMRMAAIVLQVFGIPAANIKREVFTPETPAGNIKPPDTDAHQVTISIRGSVHHLAVQYPQTILAAAKARGIELPYSCEAGRCGSCIASCVQGGVWMRYNEVLTDREVEQGRVLICQSFPVGGDVTIEYE